MVKILVIGDPHFKTDNVRDTELMVEKIIDIAITEKPNLIVNLGDTGNDHEKSKIYISKRITNFMKRLKEIAFTVMIIGNHDRPNNSTFLTDDHFFLAMKEWDNFLIVDEVQVVNLGEYKILFVPYVYPGRFQEALDTYPSLDLSEIKMVFSHQEYLNAKMGAVLSEIGDPWAIDNPFTISGHVHVYDLLQKNLMYLGTPIPQNYGESGTKYIGVVTIGEKVIDKTRLVYEYNDITVRRIPMGIGNRVTLKVNSTDVMDIQKKVETMVAEGIDVKIVVEGTTNELSSIIKRPEILELKKTALVVYDDITPVVEIQETEYLENLSFLELILKEITDPDLLAFSKKILTT